jgi:hypothetical protein
LAFLGQGHRVLIERHFLVVLALIGPRKKL